MILRKTEMEAYDDSWTVRENGGFLFNSEEGKDLRFVKYIDLDIYTYVKTEDDGVYEIFAASEKSLGYTVLTESEYGRLEKLSTLAYEAYKSFQKFKEEFNAEEVIAEKLRTEGLE